LLLLLLLARVLPRVTRDDSRPLLAPWYRAVGDGDRLLLEYAQSVLVLEGGAVRTLLPALLPLLDGTRTLDELAARLGPAVRPAIEAAVDLLRERGVVVDGPDAPPDLREASRAAAAAYGLAPATAAERLRSAAVGVVGRGGPRLDLVRLLGAAGIRDLRALRWGSRRRVDLAILVPAGDELDQVSAWNRGALATGSPFLLLRPWDGRTAAVGPLVLPGQTCCYECLLVRRAANSAYAAELAEVEAAPLAAPSDPAVEAVAAAAAAQLAVRWLVGADRTAPGVLYAIETQPALRLGEHAVLRVPRCPACSVSERAAPPLPWHVAAAA
jgi:bacteriocin biosynthesis cyclodehydratase domain-containing protein